MNYLLHIYFCTPEPETLTGACLGDFFKGRIENLPYSAAFKKGLQLHRTLDKFADTHPALLHSKQLFPAESRRMAGIALDIFYDHFLAANWTAYSPQTLNTYAQTFYAQAATCKHLLPAEAQYLLELLSRGDWLTAYQDLENITLVLKRMGRHIPFANSLGLTQNVLHENYSSLKKYFSLFMSEAREKLPGNQGVL